MSDELSQPLQQSLRARLNFYQDLGVSLFYRQRNSVALPLADIAIANSQHSENPAIAPLEPASDLQSFNHNSESPIPDVPQDAPPFHLESNFTTENVPSSDSLRETIPKKLKVLDKPTGISFFDSIAPKENDTIAGIRADLGECTRCKLHKTRNKIVFGDGNPQARLVFVGEGPGHDEDMQGLPFVGRAGKLLTQMIEAMGLQRSDVYICNVVKCRPPDNRRPENDEVAACSPFLSRQIDTIAPKVIVCLGATAAQTVLSTTEGISQFRGEWREFRGRKLMATYHPAYLLRNPAAKSEVWKDLQKVMVELGLEVKKSKPS